MTTHLHGWEALDALVSAKLLVLRRIAIDSVKRDKGEKTEGCFAVFWNHVLAMLWDEVRKLGRIGFLVVTHTAPWRNECD